MTSGQTLSFPFYLPHTRFLSFTAPRYPLPSSGSGWNLLLLLTFPSPSQRH